MKKFFKFLYTLILFIVILIGPIKDYNIGNYFVKNVVAEETASQTSEELSDKDWKIELDENTQKGSKEFDFIQKNLASADLSDNGHFLLISGIILVILSFVGVIFFSFCLYKLCKNAKKHPKNKGVRFR